MSYLKKVEEKRRENDVITCLVLVNIRKPIIINKTCVCERAFPTPEVTCNVTIKSALPIGFICDFIFKKSIWPGY